MENNNTPTTIGGVTFGGNTAPAQPAAPTAAPTAETSQQPVSPDVALNNFAAEVQTELDNASPAMESAADVQPLSQAPLANPLAPEISMRSLTPEQPQTLEPQPSPAVPQPATITPEIPNIPEITPLDTEKQKAEEEAAAKQKNLERTNKRLTIVSIVFGVLAVGFMAFGVVALIMNINTNSALEATKVKLKNAESIVSAVEDTTGVAIKTAADVPVYKATTGYIYISAWNIKLKIPDNLTNVSYILNQNEFHQSICFNAVQKGVQYFPTFANIAVNPGKMGCLTRINTNEGSFDKDSGITYGDLVFTDKRGYNYFYTGSTDFSTGENAEAELGLERTAVQIIKNMLTDNIETYE